MSKDEILQVLKNNIVDNLDDIDIRDIDVNKSMRDYGANSLDVIEVVSCSMRDLNVKVPRAELADITTIDQLADKFLEYVDA